MHLAAFGLFAAALIVCVIFDLSVIYALLAGLLIFSLCAFKMGHGLKDILKMMISGVKTAKNVILSLLLIGILTALWRAAGTIPAIICYAYSLIRPKTVVLMSFVLNCAVSMLTGTAFGTAATMGIISMTMGIAMGADPMLLGGAIVSGAYFGDHASPMSTSALLVSELTETNVFSNIRGMLRRDTEPDHRQLALYIEDTAIVLAALVPWSIACAVPLDSIGAPTSSLLASSFLYLLPLWSMLKAAHEKRHEKMPL